MEILLFYGIYVGSNFHWNWVEVPGMWIVGEYLRKPASFIKTSCLYVELGLFSNAPPQFSLRNVGKGKSTAEIKWVIWVKFHAFKSSRITLWLFKVYWETHPSWTLYHSLFTLRKPRSPLMLNGERGFLRMNRPYISAHLGIWAHHNVINIWFSSLAI